MRKEYKGIGSIKFDSLQIPVDYLVVLRNGNQNEKLSSSVYLSVLSNDVESKNALANIQETITLVMADSRELPVYLSIRNPIRNIYSGGIVSGEGAFLLE